MSEQQREVRSEPLLLLLSQCRRLFHRQTDSDREIWLQEWAVPTHNILHPNTTTTTSSIQHIIERERERIEGIAVSRQPKKLSQIFQTSTNNNKNKMWIRGILSIPRRITKCSCKTQNAYRSWQSNVLLMKQKCVQRFCCAAPGRQTAWGVQAGKKWERQTMAVWW